MTKRLVFYSILIFLALSITLGAIFYLNKSSMGSKSSEIKKDESKTSSAQVSEAPQDSSPAYVDKNGVKVVIDKDTPENYSNPELLNLESELNNLDTSNESDIQ